MESKQGKGRFYKKSGEIVEKKKEREWLRS
jgi:hypothetical protein